MDVLLMVVFGVIGGLIGGMGMGGGTLLIPLLTLFGGVTQRVAQSLNLITFLPMAIVALIVHAKNRLLDYKRAGLIIVPAVVGAIVGAVVTNKTGDGVLRLCFAIFLIILGVAQIVSIVFMKKSKNTKTDKK